MIILFLELMKYLFYSPRSRHTIKYLNFTNLGPKFVAVVPIASSQSPSSGDHHLLQRYMDLQQNNVHSENYVKTLLGGNNDYFVILITDSGFCTNLRNKPREVQNCQSLAEVNKYFPI